jgi:hypothetical protein
MLSNVSPTVSGGAAADFLGAEGGRQVSQYRGRGPNVSRLVICSHCLQTKLNVRVCIVRWCALTVYSLTWISLGVLATFGDLGWGKAEGRGQKAEVRKI